MNTESLLHGLRAELDDGGLRGSLLVRELGSGREIGIEPDLLLPTASLVKVPLAVAALDRIRRGDLDGSTPVRVAPGRVTAPGPTGLSRFRHPATVAIDDLIYLSTSVSDGVAADALFDLIPPDEVTRALREWDLHGITVRQTMRDMTDTPEQKLAAAETHLAQSLAIGAATAGGHQVAQLDVTRTNAGSARAFADLLQALWTPSKIDRGVAERVRELMRHNIVRHRLALDFGSDATRWSSKTGTLLNLRHEAGVVEHADGQTFAVVVLTESRIPAALQPEAELLMARVARTLRDHLRH